MMDYPPISQKAWSARIERWNSQKFTPVPERRRLAETCQRVGHHMYRSPMGAAWCRRCCQYFHDEGA